MPAVIRHTGVSLIAASFAEIRHFVTPFLPAAEPALYAPYAYCTPRSPLEEHESVISIARHHFLLPLSPFARPQKDIDEQPDAHAWYDNKVSLFICSFVPRRLLATRQAVGCYEHTQWRCAYFMRRCSRAVRRIWRIPRCAAGSIGHTAECHVSPRSRHHATSTTMLRVVPRQPQLIVIALLYASLF